MNMTTIQTTTPYRYDYLLAFRGVLAFTVVIHHWQFDELLASVLPFGLSRFIAPDGSYSVFLFFVLSGYLMSKVLHTKYQDRRGIAHFYQNRIVRIVPVYLVAIFFTVLVTTAPAWYHLLAGTGTTAQLKAVFPWATLWPLSLGIANYGLLGNFPNPALWSINTEMQFYIIAPLLLILLPRYWRPAHLAAIFMLAILGNLALRLLYQQWWGAAITDHPQVYMGLETNLVYFLAGWTAYRCREHLPKVSALLAFTLMMGILIAAWVLDVYFRRVDLYGPFGSPLWYLVMPTLFALTAFFLLPSLDYPMQRTPLGRLLTFLGITSFAVYTLHMPFHYLLHAMAQRTIPLIEHPLFSLIALYGLCIAVYYLIEKPSYSLRFQSAHSPTPVPMSASAAG